MNIFHLRQKANLIMLQIQIVYLIEIKKKNKKKKLSTAFQNNSIAIFNYFN